MLYIAKLVLPLSDIHYSNAIMYVYYFASIIVCIIILQELAGLLLAQKHEPEEQTDHHVLFSLLEPFPSLHSHPSSPSPGALEQPGLGATKEPRTELGNMAPPQRAWG